MVHWSIFKVIRDFVVSFGFFGGERKDFYQEDRGKIVN